MAIHAELTAQTAETIVAWLLVLVAPSNLLLASLARSASTLSAMLPAMIRLRHLPTLQFSSWHS